MKIYFLALFLEVNYNNYYRKKLLKKSNFGFK